MDAPSSSETRAESDRPGRLDAEIAAEQAAVDRAYERLGAMRESALDVVRHHQELSEVRAFQARVEWESILALTDQRLQHLDLGEQALCFGRLDRTDGETYQVGRLSILDEDGDPLVIDWRAPAAEAFYRATGKDPMGLVRRRHLLTKGRRVVGLDDEVFDLDSAEESGLGVIGEGALMAALDRSRTGRMGDIVATIQAEQDEVVRAPLPGILIVQGGPGTGKTAVALHRAAYLLYTNRERLSDAGVLVIGPNRVFLRYIEQVLPSLGESGVELATTERLYGRVAVRGSDTPAAERVKGDARMVEVIARAVTDRQRGLGGGLEIPYGSRTIRVPKGELDRLVEQVRRRRGTHNERRRVFVRRLRRLVWRRYQRMAEKHPRPTVDQAQAALFAVEGESEPDNGPGSAEREQERFDDTIGTIREFRAALERMWPTLTPEQLLHDLYGGPALLQLASRGLLDADERRALERPRSASVGEVAWTAADVPLLDEASVLLGPVPQRRRGARQVRDDARWMIEDTVADITLQTGELDPHMQRELIRRLTDAEAAALGTDEDGGPNAYGHLIVDEAQDLSTMQWRMLARRCPTGSMTIVGDLGQASGASAARAWDDVLEHLPTRREPRLAELTVNYRTPTEIMDLAAAVLRASDADLEPPRSVRDAGIGPSTERVDDDGLAERAVARAAALLDELDDGKVAIVVPEDRRAGVQELLDGRDDEERTSRNDPLDAPIAAFTAVEAKGLEFDGVVLVEPAELVAERPQGLRALYVALTRATRRLAIVHGADLPEPMAAALEPS
ncbi:MAG: AAA family ATPase [Actinomycetota bacterium]|nr:AAA family ATPase [Actinomycetota bacterium]